MTIVLRGHLAKAALPGALAVLLAAGASRAEPARAGASKCGQCFSSGYSETHFFWGTGCGPSGGCMDCEAFNACHTNTQPGGNCAEWHFACAGSPVETAVLVRSAAEAVAHADARGAGRLLAEYPERVRYNAGRHALQVTGCSGEVVASLAVPLSVLAVLETGEAPRAE